MVSITFTMSPPTEPEGTAKAPQFTTISWQRAIGIINKVREYTIFIKEKLTLTKWGCTTPLPTGQTLSCAPSYQVVASLT